jgi:hypothetical protein
MRATLGTTRGIAKGEWLDDAFVQLRAWFEGDGNAIFGDSADADCWMLHRADPDFHQRLIGRVEGSRILAHPDISEDEGATWVKDFDMTFTRSD